MTVKCLSKGANVHLRFAAVKKKSSLFTLAIEMFTQIFLLRYRREPRAISFTRRIRRLFA